MPPKTISSKRPTFTRKANGRLRPAYKMKSVLKRQPTSSKKENLSPTKKATGSGRPPNKKFKVNAESASERQLTSSSREGQLTSSKKENPLSTKKATSKGRPAYKKSKVNTEPSSSKGRQSTSSKTKNPSPIKATGKGRQPYKNLKGASSTARQSTSTKKPPVIKVPKLTIEEICDSVAKMGPEDADFSRYIVKIFTELHPTFEIAEEAVTDLNAHLNRIFRYLVKKASFIRLCVRKATLTVTHIETILKISFPTNLSLYSIAEGRKALKKWSG